LLPHRELLSCSRALSAPPFFCFVLGGGNTSERNTMERKKCAHQIGCDFHNHLFFFPSFSLPSLSPSPSPPNQSKVDDVLLDCCDASPAAGCGEGFLLTPNEAACVGIVDTDPADDGYTITWEQCYVRPFLSCTVPFSFSYDSHISFFPPFFFLQIRGLIT
jgi:hypothetical protein